MKAAAVTEDKIPALLEWMDSLDEPELLVPEGRVRVLVAPMGAGKTELAHRWFTQGLREADADPAVEVPQWFDARGAVPDLETALAERAETGSHRGRCRIVLDGLDTVGARLGAELLADAREVAATWPGVSIILTARPGLTLAKDEILGVDDWSESRGIQVVELLTGDRLPSELMIAEVLDALRSPLLALALAARIRTDEPAAVSRWELLSGLAKSTIQANRPDNPDENLWPALMKLARIGLNSDGPVLDDEFGTEPEVWKVADTGLVTANEGRISFSLPVFEQYFGARAVFTGAQRIEDAAAADAFPKWRYALAFAVASIPEEADNRLTQLTRTNPAAASWILDEIDTGHTQTGDRGESRTYTAASGWLNKDDEHVPALALGQWLREAQQSWLDGLGPIGRLVARHGPDGRLVRWGVWLADDHQYATVAEADTATGKPDVVELDEPWPDRSSSGWTRVMGVNAPTHPLGRWHWTRARLREPLKRLLRRRTLPCSPDSPLAQERLWFLAQLITLRRSSARHEPISTQLLNDKVSEMLNRAEGARSSHWQISGYEIDQDDVRWLHAMLRNIADVDIRRPAPLPDRPNAGYSATRMYSAERTVALATEVLRSAVIGYRDLVRINFPAFGSALGHFSALPLEIDGVVEISEDAPIGLEAGLFYRMRHAPDASADTPPRVHLILSTDPSAAPVDVSTAFWTNRLERPASSRPKFTYTTMTDTVIEMYHARPATNLAYSWLSDDLRALGWVDQDMTFFD